MWLAVPTACSRIEIAPVWSEKGPILKQSETQRTFHMKIPLNIQIQYELDGVGRVETGPDGLRLINLNGTAVVWRRFQLTPRQFLEE